MQDPGVRARADETVTAAGWAQLAVLVALVAVSTPVLGGYLARVYGHGRPAPGDRFFTAVERRIYRLGGVDPAGDQRWSEYAGALLIFSLIGVLLLYAVLRLQGHLPLNPDHHGGFPPALAFNAAISFATTTDWESYLGESTISQLSDTFGVVLQMFLASAIGMAVAVALIRGLTRQRTVGLGSFWVGLTRMVVRVVLPLSFVFAVVLMAQGVLDDFGGQTSVATVAGVAHHVGGPGPGTLTQRIPGSPVASQVVPEILGNNGGGPFNANLAHPYENPSPVTNLLFDWLTLMLPFALTWTFGRMVGSLRQGLTVLASMTILFLAPILIIWPFEAGGNPQLRVAGVTQAATSSQGGGNMEGKEVRFGTAASSLTTGVMTSTTAGAPDSAVESYVPLSGGTALANMMLGEVSPGGDGSGLFGKLVLALLSVFIAGLMVGRTPEYLGKKIQSAEMKLAVIYLLAVPLVVLVFAGISIVSGFATRQLSTTGTHGLTELLYAYTSVANGNGSAFAGISAGTTWYDVTFGVAMFVGRYVLILPVLAIGGSLARKRLTPVTAGTMRTDTPIFVALLTAVTVLLVGLTYFPILALGPVAEQLGRHV